MSSRQPQVVSCCLIEVFGFYTYLLKVRFVLQIATSFFVVDFTTKLRSGVQQSEPGILSSHHLSVTYNYGNHPPDIIPDQ